MYSYYCFYYCSYYFSNYYCFTFIAYLLHRQIISIPHFVSFFFNSIRQNTAQKEIFEIFFCHNLCSILSKSNLSATLLRKRHWHRCFPANFAKFLKTPFLTEHLWWLHLDISEKFYISSNENQTTPS